MTGIPALPVIAIAALLAGCTRADRARAAADSATSADTTRVSSASPPRWATDAARTLERQLQRELFNSSDTGFVAGARDCEEGGEDEPPPGYALVRATLADHPVVSVEEPRDAHIRAILTSVARTLHHEGGDEEEVDVDVGVKVDTADIPASRSSGLACGEALDAAQRLMADGYQAGGFRRPRSLTLAPRLDRTMRPS